MKTKRLYIIGILVLLGYGKCSLNLFNGQLWTSLQKGLGLTWNIYTELRDHYNNYSVSSLTAPPIVLELLKFKLDEPNRSDLDVSNSGNHRVQPVATKTNRQGDAEPDVVEVPGGLGFFNDLGGYALLPLAIMGLSMGITLFGLNLANRVDAPKLAELRQQQLNALANLAGIPLSVVAPPNSTEETEIFINQGEPERISEQQEILKRTGVTMPIYKNATIKNSTEIRTGNREAIAGHDQAAIVFAMVTSWVAGVCSLHYFGAGTTLLIGLALVLFLLLPNTALQALLNKDGYSARHRNKILNEAGCSRKIDEVQVQVQKGIAYLY